MCIMFKPKVVRTPCLNFAVYRRRKFRYCTSVGGVTRRGINIMHNIAHNTKLRILKSTPPHVLIVV